MKSRILFTATLLAIFAMAVVAFAYNSQTGTTKAAAAECCCKSGSCPMKKMDGEAAKTSADGEKKESCCDMPECCCNGGACPMMKKGDQAKAGVEKAAEHKMDCCKDGDSCPMMKKGEGHASSEAHHPEMKDHAEMKGHGAAKDHTKMKDHSAMKADGHSSEGHTCCACCAPAKAE